MKIAYLCCPITLPDAKVRHSAAPEHDRMAVMLRAALAEKGGTLTEISWDAKDEDWGAYDAALIGSTWDYIDRHEEFLSALENIERQTKLFNSLVFVRWNSVKTYLQELSELGANTVSTIWLPSPTEAAVRSAFNLIGTKDMVVKPQIGAGAEGQHRVKFGDPIPKFDRPMMAQMFFPSIQTEGEYSFIFIDGVYSHAVQKQAKGEDYRVQSEYGGTDKPYDPPKEDLAAAKGIMECLEDTPLYARVDMIRSEDGRLFLMELECIEPYLFPDHVKDLGGKIVTALTKRLAHSA